jgi:FAD/FMN-containing dehydrogenase
MTTRRALLRLAAIATAWPGLAWTQAAKKAKPPPPPGILVNDVHSQLNGTRVAAIETPQSLDAVRALIATARKDELPVCFSGARHSMGGQQFCAEGLLVDARKLNRVLNFDRERGLIEVESGTQWPELLRHLHAAQRGAPQPWAFAQKQAGADRLTVGGSLSANIHGRGLAMAPFIHDVEAFKLLTARGNIVNCSRTENGELFRLAIGGFGLFGFIYSVTLRLVPRRKLERVVEIRDLDGLPAALGERVRDGFLYGDFQYAVDENSGDFLRRGVFCCYRPIDDLMPMPSLQRDLTEGDRAELMYLAHTDKFEAFRRLAAYYQSTNGQIYWSDEQQMTPYADDYHRALDRRMRAQHRGSEALTEIYCPRDALERFMADARVYARRDGLNIVQGRVRLVEEDRESFLRWARQPYACISFHLHVEHTTGGMIRAGDALRRLVDLGLRHGGGYSLAYNRYALERQVLACYPQFPEFLKLKRKYDPQEVFQSEWYRHYKRMFFPDR